MAIGEERLYTGKSTTTGWRQFRLRLLILTLGHKENSDHLEGSLGHSQTEGPWEREKEITCSNDESSKQRFDKKKGGRKKSKQQQGKGASKKKNIATEHMKILARKLRKLYLNAIHIISIRNKTSGTFFIFRLRELN